MKKPYKIKVLDVGISQVDIDDIKKIVVDYIKTSEKGYVTVTGASGVIASHDDPKIKEIFNNSFMSIPDGMPCLGVKGLKGSHHIKRCFGPEVFMEIMKISRQHNIRHFLWW